MVPATMMTAKPHGRRSTRSMSRCTSARRCYDENHDNRCACRAAPVMPRLWLGTPLRLYCGECFYARLLSLFRFAAIWHPVLLMQK